MPQVKLTSITAVKESDIPQRQVNTALKDLADLIIKELTAKPNQPAFNITTENSGKYTRYALQKRLQKAKHKVSVRSGNKKGEFFIVRGS